LVLVEIKAFFSEGKKHKTFIEHLRTHRAAHTQYQTFLGLFSKKTTFFLGANTAMPKNLGGAARGGGLRRL